MSADNTVLILETEDGYRVAEVQAAENLNEPNSEFKRQYIDSNFGDKVLLYRESEAWKQAETLYTKIKSSGRFVEYGIQLIKLDGNNEIAPDSDLDHNCEPEIFDDRDYGDY